MPSHLTHGQVNAAIMIASGMSHTAVAEQVGVTRETISVWKRNPEFIARLKAEQDMHADSARAALTQLRDEALAIGMHALRRAQGLLDDLGDKASVNDAVVVSREAREWVKTSAPHTGLVERREVELTPSEQLEQVLARVVDGKTPEELDDAIARLKAAS